MTVESGWRDRPEERIEPLDAVVVEDNVGWPTSRDGWIITPEHPLHWPDEAGELFKSARQLELPPRRTGRHEPGEDDVMVVKYESGYWLVTEPLGFVTNHTPGVMDAFRRVARSNGDDD